MAFGSWEERELAHSVALIFTSTWRNYRSREKPGYGKDIRTLRDPCSVCRSRESRAVWRRCNCGREAWERGFSDILSLALLQPGAVFSKWAENSAAAWTWQCPGAMWECRNSGWGQVLTEQTSAVRDLTPCPTFSCSVRAGGFSHLEDDAEDLSGGTAANRRDWQRLLDTLTPTQSHHFFCLHSSGGI